MATILIIDDQLTSRQILQQLVSSIEGNLTVKAFENPLEALKWTETNTFNLVLTDYQMPEMNGIEFIKRLRSNPALTHIPVIMVTPAHTESAIQNNQRPVSMAGAPCCRSNQ